MLKHLKQRRTSSTVLPNNIDPSTQEKAQVGSGSTSGPKSKKMPVAEMAQIRHDALQHNQQTTKSQARRVRGRRSSKPAMEKRRRARMNQSLDELKFYVLNDQNNLRRLGIDSSSIENMDEETVARTMLKSSGLIHRHRGRKNPNKLEKADILELTVDYVRMLLKQNDQLSTRPNNENVQKEAIPTVVPLKLSLPLTDQARLSFQPIPPSPPNSLDSSNSPQPLLTITSNTQHWLSDNPCDALDLRSSNKQIKSTEGETRMSICEPSIHYSSLYQNHDASLHHYQSYWKHLNNN